MDYFLKFNSENYMKNELGAYTPDGEDCTIYRFVDHMAIDIVGTIYKPTGEFIERDGILFPEYGPVDGYHVNLRGDDLPENLLKYCVYPTVPYRVWA